MSGSSLAQQSAALASVDASEVSSIPELRMSIVELAGATATTSDAALLAEPAVKSVERDHSRDVEGAPNDSRYPDQWSLPRIGWDALQSEGLPTGRVTVAILDTGVDASAPDLAGRLLPGVSFVDGSPVGTDPHGHGTWLAGIVAAATGNGTGIAGIGGAGVRVLPITVLGADGTGQDSAVISGIVAAVDGHADVILMAFSNPTYSPALQVAIDYAWAHDVVLVAANGNDGSSARAFPAGDRGVMGIASTDRADGLATGSNHGPQTFLGAPGVDILTTAADADGDPGTDDDYVSINGTSAAAAEVAGAVAVLRAIDPGASNAVIVGRLARSAAPAGTQDETGNGRLDLARAASDTTTGPIVPAGVAGTADGGPFVGPYVAATLRTWSGAGTDNNWSTAGNWGGTTPIAGDDLVFPVGAARLANTNDILAGTSFNSITISGTGYTLSGNGIALATGNLTASAVGATNVVNIALSFAAVDSITITDAGATLTVGGIVSGPGGLTKLGLGTLVVSAVNSYAGVTTVTSGVIRVQSNTGLGSTAGATSVASGAAIEIDGTGLLIAEPISGIIGTGTGTAGALRNLANANSWSGAIILGAGGATVTSDGGTLTLPGGVTGNTRPLSVGGAGNTTINSAIATTTGSLTKDGTGILVLSIVNTYSGLTAIKAGTLKLGIANAIGASSTLTVAGSSTFDLNGFSDTIGSLAGAGSLTSGVAGAVTLTSGNTVSTTFSGVASNGSGTLTLVKVGTSTLTLSGTNTYTGVTTLTAGVIRVQSNAALGTTAGGTTVASGAAVEIDGAGLLIAEPITALSGTGVGAAGALRNLANDNIWSGAIAMLAASRVNSDGGTLTLSGPMTGAGLALTVGGTGNTSVGGVIGTTTGTLTKDGTGTLVLSAVNTYTGASTVSAGVIRVQSNAALGTTAGATSVVTGAAIEIDGTGLNIAEPITSLIGTGIAGAGAIRNLANSNTWSGAIGLGAGGATITSDGGTLTLAGLTGNTRPLSIGGAGNVTIGGVIATTSGTLTKDGAGTLLLSAVNTYSGLTAINAGILRLGNANAIGATNLLTVAGPGTFDMNGFSVTIGSFAGAGSITSGAAGSVVLTAGLAASTVFSGVASDGSGALSLVKTGAGTLTLSGINTYTGATTINAGTISIGADSGLGTAPASATPGQLTLNTGTLLVTATMTLDPDRGIALTGAGTVSIVSPFVITYGGIIAGAGTLTKLGTGTVTLDGVNTYPGVTTVTAGVIRVQSNAALGTTAGGTTVASGAAIEIDGTGLLIAEPITALSGTGVGAAGALRNLANDNTWSGNLTMALASRVNSDGGTLTLSGAIGGAFGLTVGGVGNTTIGGVIGTTTGTLTKDGSGILTLSAVNTYTGLTLISVGTIRLGIANAIGAGSALTVTGTFDLNGFSEAIGSLAGAGSVTSGVTGAVTLTSGANNTGTTYSGIASDGSGSLSMVKTGTLVLTLSGINTYTGVTTINGGSISIAADSGLGTAPTSATPGQLVLNGGTLVVTAAGTLSANRGFALTGPGTISNALALTYGGVMAGPGTLTKLGAGVLTLSGFNTYAGATFINAGTISIATDSGLGVAPVSATPGQLTFNAGTLVTSASFSLDPNRGIALTGAAIIAPNTATSLTYGGILAGASTLTLNGAGTLILGGVNTYSGATFLTTGTLSIAADGALGSAPGSATPGKLTFGGGVLLVSATMTLASNRGVALTGAATISTNALVTLTYGGIMAGASTLTKLGAGTLVLSGVNTYAGLTTVSAGVLRVQSNAALGTVAGATTVTSGAAIEIDGSGLLIAEPLNTLAGAGIAAGGALRNLANNNTWSGAITFGATPRINSDAGTLTVSTGMTGSAAALSVGGLGNTTIGGVIGTITGTLTKDGTGTAVLSAVNTYSGATSITAGILKVGIANAIGASSALTVTAPGTLDLNGFNDTVGSLTGTGSVTNGVAGLATLTSGGLGTSTTFSGVASDSGGPLALAKAGALVLTLSGANTYTGATTIIAGTVSIAADANLGAAPGSATPGQLVFNGGILLVTANMALASTRGIALTGPGTVSTTFLVTYGGIIAGASTLTKLGTGTLTLSGVNTYSGATLISAGVVSIAADSGLGTAPGSATPGQLTFNVGTLQATVSFTLAANRGIALTGAGTITTDPGVTLTYGGIMAGASTVTKLGTGTLALGGASSYSGVTTLTAGILRVQSNGALGTTAGGTTVASGTGIEIDGSGLLIPEPITSLNGTGVAAAGGLHNLANDNTWSGNITMVAASRVNSDGGTLTLPGTITGAFGLTVGGAGNTTIGGVIGTVAGTLTKDGAGVLTLSAVNTYTGLTNISVGTIRLGVANAIGASSAVTVTGTFDLNGFSDTIGSLAGAGGVTNGAAGAVTLTSGGLNTSTTYSGVASDGIGTLAMAKAGTLILTLSGINTYSGGTAINGGTISIGAESALGAAPGSATPGQLTFNTGTLLVTAGFAINSNRGIALNGPGIVSTTFVVTYAGIIAGVGTLTKLGTGTFTLTGVNTYTGATSINAGLLSIAADSGLGTAPGSVAPGQLSLSTGTLVTSTTFTLNANRGTTTTGSGQFSPMTGTTLTYGGIIAGGGSFSMGGVGTLVLAGANSYTGGTSLGAGILSVSADSNLGAAPGGLSFVLGTLLVSSSFTLDATRTIGLASPSSISINPGVTLTFAGVVNGSGNWTKLGTGTLVLNGVNTNTGSTIIAAGTIAIAADSGLGTAPGAATPGKLTLSWGAVLLATSSFTLASNRGIALTGDANISTNALVTLTYGGIIAGNNSVTKLGTGTLVLSGVNSYVGATFIVAGTISIAANSGLGAGPGGATAGWLTFVGGTLRTTATFTLNANRGIALNTGFGTFDVASGTTLAYSGIAVGPGSLTKTSAGTLDLSGASATVGGVTIAAGTLIGPTAGSFGVAGDWANNASTSAFTGGTGTVTLNGASAQSVGGSFTTTFNGLTVANASGISLAVDTTVGGTLTFSSGTVTTGSQTMYVASGGSVSRTSGYVVGNLKKFIATGATNRTFEVGNAGVYAPIAVAFASVTTAGDLTATTTGAEHPSIGASTIDPAKDVNRSWTLTNGGVSFTTYSATFTFVAGDLDPGVDYLHVVVQSYSAGAWTPLVIGTRTSTSTQAVGIDHFGDFAVGEQTGAAFDHFVVVAPSTATAGTAFDVTVTSVDSVGNTLTGYVGTIMFDSTDDYAGFSPSSYTFLSGDNGSKTFAAGAILKVAGSQTISVSDGSNGGTSDPISVGPATFVKLLVLAPGETRDPGSATGRTGSPTAQSANSAFSVTVKAVDAYWNVASSTHTVAITSSDPSAVLPSNAALAAGSHVFSVILETSGAATITATDVTDGTRTAGVSTPITVLDTAPNVVDDGYTVRQDNTLTVPAAGVLSNDADADGQGILVATPRPVSGPSHGTLTLNADGSFSYTPDAGYSGPDSFTYTATDGTLTSSAATVTIDVISSAFTSASGWSTSFDSSRYLTLTFPAYVPAGSVVTSATFRHEYRSETAGDTTCYFFEVYGGGTLLGTHGSAGSPVSCNSTSSYASDAVALPEVASVANANSVTIKLFVWNSGGRRSQHRIATLGVTYSLD